MIFYAVLCAVSLALAAHAGGRLLAVTALFVAFWMLTASDWLPLSPRQILHGTGLDFQQYQIWGFTDALEALAILYIGGKRWWVFGLVGLFCVQEIAHDLYGRFGLYDWASYTSLLNDLFLMQVGLLILAGITEGSDGLRNNADVRWPRRLRLATVSRV